MVSETPVRNYRDLLIWQKAMALVEDVYVITRGFPADEKFGLTSQVRRAAVSVPSNIAEGHTRQHDNELRRFLYIALGSLAELDTQLELSVRLGYIAPEGLCEITKDALGLRKMMFGLIARLRTTH